MDKKDLVVKISILEQRLNALTEVVSLIKQGSEAPKKKMSPETINFDPIKKVRHLRELGLYEGTISNHSGVTFVHTMDESARVIQVGWAVCSDKDNFCRKTGTEIATRRFHENPKFIELSDEVEYNEADIHQYVVEALYNSGVVCDLYTIDPSYTNSIFIFEILNSLPAHSKI